MYCPTCATQNIDAAKFCRACGSNLSLVPQALSGRLPDPRADVIKEAIRRKREPNLARGISTTSMGLAFLTIVAVSFLTRGSHGFGAIWLLIPAFALLGRGIARIVAAINAQRVTNQMPMSPPVQPTSELPPRPLYDPLAPPSITEGTTRHLDTVPQRPGKTV